MATVDYTNGSAVIPFGGLNKVYTVENTIDFSKKNAAASTVVEALNVAAGTHVLNVWVTVDTPQGAASTATVGDAGTPAGFDAATDLNAAAGTTTYGVGTYMNAVPAVAIQDAYVAAGGHYYATADTIDLTLSAAAVDTAVITVKALCVQVI